MSMRRVKADAEGAEWEQGHGEMLSVKTGKRAKEHILKNSAA